MGAKSATKDVVLSMELANGAIVSNAQNVKRAMFRVVCKEMAPKAVRSVKAVNGASALRSPVPTVNSALVLCPPANREPNNAWKASGISVSNHLAMKAQSNSALQPPAKMASKNA